MKHPSTAEAGKKDTEHSSPGLIHALRWPVASVLIAWAAVVGIALVLQTPLNVRLSNSGPIVVTLDDGKAIQVHVQDHHVRVDEEVNVFIKGGHLDAEANVDSSL